MAAKRSPRTIQMLVAPYDSGVEDSRMGSGPLALHLPAERCLRSAGHHVESRRIDPAPNWHPEIESAFQIQGAVSHEVRAALQRDAFPLLLSGNCNATLGTVAGLTSLPGRVGLIWFDALADFKTPETTKTGFLDGQGLTMIVGRCWTQVTMSVPGFSPVPESDVVLIGARDIGTLEERALRDSRITRLPPSAARSDTTLIAAVAALARSVDVVHVHIDLDVLDPIRVAPRELLCGSRRDASERGVLRGDHHRRPHSDRLRHTLFVRSHARSQRQDARGSDRPHQSSRQALDVSSRDVVESGEGCAANR